MNQERIDSLVSKLEALKTLKADIEDMAESAEDINDAIEEAEGELNDLRDEFEELLEDEEKLFEPSTGAPENQVDDLHNTEQGNPTFPPQELSSEPEGYVKPSNEEEEIDEEEGNTGEGKQTDPNEEEDEIDAAELAGATKEKSFSDIAKVKGLPEPTEDGSVSFRSQLSFSLKEIKIKGSKRAKTPDDYHPSEDDMTRINLLANVDLKPTDVYSFTLRSADLDVDRGYEQFIPRALKQMAQMSVDKPLLIDHEWKTTNIVGKIYDASVKNQGLQQKVYMLNVPENQLLIKNIMGGLYNKVSVGFKMNPMEYTCKSCKISMYSAACPHQPGAMDEHGNIGTAEIRGVKDYFETSLVAVPMQPNAGIRRNDVGAGPGFSDILSAEKQLIGRTFNNSIFEKGGLLSRLIQLPSVDRIVNEKSILGDGMVSKPEDKKPEAEIKVDLQKEEPKAEVKSAADAVPEEKAGSPRADSGPDPEDEKGPGCSSGKPKKKAEKNVLKALNKSIKRLEKTCKKLDKAVQTSAMAMVQMAKNFESQSTLIEKAMSISTEELERGAIAKLLSLESEAAPEPAGKHGYMGGVFKALEKTVSQKEAQ